MTGPTGVVTGPAGVVVDPAVLVAALSGLPGMGPARLGAVLAAFGTAGAWQEIRAGRVHRHPGVAAALGRGAAHQAGQWARAASAVDLDAVAARHKAAGVRLALPGRAGFPARLAVDPDPPHVLCVGGGAEVDAVPTVAIVGTRACTADGRETAFGLARELSECGVSIVSGLARGIDGAAHAGALEARAGAPPVGVVATGLDVVYPPDHGGLWTAVRQRGVLLSEAPLGTRPERWRFPARNRLIAGLADAVVVVESHASGGSLHTVDAAADRGVPVLAVPGSVRSPASAGTNALLAERAIPCCSADDVLVALGLEGAIVNRPEPASDRRPPPLEADRAVLDAVGWTSTATESVLARTGLSPIVAAAALTRLAGQGWIRAEDGWWSRS